jgi:hypothetical protein
MIIIGRSETVSLPELGLSDLNARIDTGAATSSLHCHKIKKIRSEEGISKIEFYVLDPAHPEYNSQKYTFEKYGVRNVKSSNGITQKRYLIKTKIRFGEKLYRIEFTLADRSEMTYPILIGRQFISKKFLVDVSKKNTLLK